MFFLRSTRSDCYYLWHFWCKICFYFAKTNKAQQRSMKLFFAKQTLINGCERHITVGSHNSYSCSLNIPFHVTYYIHMRYHKYIYIYINCLGFVSSRLDIPASSRLDVSTTQWCHNKRDGVSNHQPQDCLLNGLFGRRSKKTSKLHVTGLCQGNSPVTGAFPSQRTSNAENVSNWWRHHDLELLHYMLSFSLINIKYTQCRGSG